MAYQGASSYAGYGSPERAKVDRARQMAELLQQGATDTSPKSFWEGAAQLGKAFIARGAMDKADKAETSYAKNQERLLRHFMDPNTTDDGYAMQPTINVGADPEPQAATPAPASPMPEGDKVKALARALGGVYEGDGRTADIGAKQVALPPMQPPMSPGVQKIAETIQRQGGNPALETQQYTQPVQPGAPADAPAAPQVPQSVEAITAALTPPPQPQAGAMPPAAPQMAAPTMAASPAMVQAPQSSRPPPPAAPNRQAALMTAMRMTGGNLQEAMSLVEAKYGAAPAGPEYQFFHGQNGFVGRGDKTSGEFETLQQGTPEAPDPVKYEQFTDASGQVWDVNPYTRERIKADGMRARVPQDSPSSANDTFRPATPEDRARWGLPPEGAFKINERTGEPAAISGARAAQDFSPTEIRAFRDQADGLYILQNAVNQYVNMLEKMGGPQLFDTPLNAENVQALKSSHGLITEAIKDAGKLGALDQGVQNLVNAIIQEPVGLGTFGKSTESIKQAANQLNSSIEFKLSRVPEEYRAGSTGAVPDFDGDDDDFIDTLFEPAAAAPAPAPASSRATPMATVNPGTSTGRFHKGSDPRQTQRPTAPRTAAIPPEVDPEDWKYFTPEMKQQYLAGRGQ